MKLSPVVTTVGDARWNELDTASVGEHRRGVDCCVRVSEAGMPHRGERWVAPSAVDGVGFADYWLVGLGDARHLRRPFGPRFLSKLLFRGHCDCTRFATTPTEPRIRASSSRVVKNSRGVARMSAPRCSGHRTSRCAAASDMRLCWELKG
jgi:hypothetical protein